MRGHQDTTRQRILTELAAVQRDIAELRNAQRSEELQSGGDNTPLSEEAEAAQLGNETEIRMDIVGLLLDRQQALVKALRRTVDGTYGRCTACGHQIPRRRLLRVPEAILCVTCKARRERGHPTARVEPWEWMEVEEAFARRHDFEEDTGRPPKEVLQ